MSAMYESSFFHVIQDIDAPCSVQDIVKDLFTDAAFNAEQRLGAINSINWARILVQIVYYFSSYFRIRALLAAQTDLKEIAIQYAVPTGNFGDVLAGYYAKRMGLPMSKLVIATNSNDILTRFWKTGRYERVDSAGVGIPRQSFSFLPTLTLGRQRVAR
jgi:threonine synthase